MCYCGASPGTKILLSPWNRVGILFLLLFQDGAEIDLSRLLLIQIAVSFSIRATCKTKMEKKSILFPLCSVLWSGNEAPSLQHCSNGNVSHPHCSHSPGCPWAFPVEFQAQVERKGEAQHQKWESRFSSLQTLRVIFIFLKSARVAPIHEKLLWGRFYLHFYFQLGSVHL